LGTHFQVVIANDGYEASELLVREQPDAVISDLTMPRTGGFALLELARRRNELSEIPILVLSGTSDTETKIKAFELGAADYLTKPVSLAELIARTKNALSRAQALRRERLLQETDDLTGLANRRALRKILGDAIRYSVSSRRPLTVAMVDQDKLKQINDRFGHAAGDAAIRQLAKALSSCKRGSDCAARYGGDEFCVVMPGTDRAGAEKFVQRVHDELAANPIDVGGVRIQVSASFGLAALGEVAWEESWEELMGRADQALYEQKSSRRAEKLAKAAEVFFRTWPEDATGSAPKKAS
jgi:two-component system cell cycle response regulator